LKSFLPGFNQLGFFRLLFAQGECRLSVGFQAGQVRQMMKSYCDLISDDSLD
jgi:hypothetical protein